MATGQPPNAMNRHRPAGKQVPFSLLVPVLEPQLDKERAMQLQSLYVRLMSLNINKDEFVRHMRSLVGDHMLKMAANKIQQEQLTAKPSIDNNPQKQRLLEQQSDSHGVHLSHDSSNVNAIKQDRNQPFPMQELGKQHQQHMPCPQSAGNSSLASRINAKTPLKKPIVGQKKPLEAPVSSLSKKQKVSGAFSYKSIYQQLNDAIAVSKANLRHSKMEVQNLLSEKTRSLPPNIIQRILTFMPMRDAFRTSILSQNWRYHCRNIPKLMFDDAVFRGSTCKAVSIRWKLLYIVYPILLLHQGPIHEFSLRISQLISCCEIDQIILHLSRSDTLKKLTLCIGSGDDHKLLPAFFNLQQLMVLKLQNCVFQPPVTFKGFSRLVSLSFNNVSITEEVFLRFISNCPELMYFTLIGDARHLLGCWNSDFVELFECLPLVERLRMSWYPIKCFATAVMPQKLPTLLVHIKYLHLQGLSFARETDLLSALLLVASSPNIERIILEMQHNPNEALSQTAMNLIHQQDYSHVVLLYHLCAVTITNFTNMKTRMDFVKLILANSPMLKMVDIVIDKRVDVNGEVKMLKELLQYPRASAKAEIRFKRP